MMKKHLNAFQKVINSFHLFAFYWIFMDSVERIKSIRRFLSEKPLYGWMCACVSFFSTSLIAFINAIRFINVISYQYQVHHSYQSRIYYVWAMRMHLDSRLLLWDWNDVKMWWHANATTCLTYKCMDVMVVGRLRLKWFTTRHWHLNPCTH